VQGIEEELPYVLTGVPARYYMIVGQAGTDKIGRKWSGKRYCKGRAL